MSRLDRSILYIARFVIEARTALSIGTGGSDGVYDHPIVRDANGLPMIPGTSLAGVLRHLWIQEYKQASADALFGYQRRDQGEASRLEVAAGALQDSKAQPVAGLLLGAQQDRLKDPLLAAALKTREDPLFRDRVQIGHRGVAVKTAKFDRGLLMAGNRFSGELRLWSDIKDDPDWSALLGLLTDPRLRLGGGTRTGLGVLKLISLHQGQFDLHDPTGIAAFQKVSHRLVDLTGLTASPIERLPAPAAQMRTLTIQLDPRDFWRIGQGSDSLLPINQRPDKKTPDLLPKQEGMVSWDKQGQASIRTRFALVPGSAVKGALAHRTAFHWNVLTGTFVDGMTCDQIAEWDKSKDCAGIQALFGYAKDRATAPGRDLDSTGQAGHILIDDVHVEITEQDLRTRVQTMIHNSLDRFTGGVRNRMLFTEELIYQRAIPLTITLLSGVDQADQTARQAFALALRDLCEGRLALGGGATKGHGAFTGVPDANTRAWLTEQGENPA